jgi:hypothetical protein
LLFVADVAEVQFGCRFEFEIIGIGELFIVFGALLFRHIGQPLFKVIFMDNFKHVLHLRPPFGFELGVYFPCSVLLMSSL